MPGSGLLFRYFVSLFCFFMRRVAFAGGAVLLELELPLLIRALRRLVVASLALGADQGHVDPFPH